MNRSSALLLAFVFLSGCQAWPPFRRTVRRRSKTAPRPEKPKVYSSFSEETVFSLLSAELAGQRNRFDIALDNYVTQAINTQDPGISERAFRIAEYLGADQAALDTALIWAKNARTTSKRSAPPPCNWPAPGVTTTPWSTWRKSCRQGRHPFRLPRTVGRRHRPGNPQRPDEEFRPPAAAPPEEQPADFRQGLAAATGRRQ
jgi:hypothetical protein